MRGLIVYFAVGCLAIASAAPAEESNKQITKHFIFSEDVIFPSTAPILKGEFMMGRCEGSGDDQKCSIHLDKLDSYDKLNTSCYIPRLTVSSQLADNVVLTNAGNSRAVIALKEGQTKMKLISVNLKDCEIHETSVDLLDIFMNEADRRLDVIIVAHDKNYDVFYQNGKICRYYLCKTTIDFEGKVVKAAAIFPIQILYHSHVSSIVHVNNGYLVTQNVQSTVNVYLVKDGEDTARILFSAYQGPQLPDSTVLSSTDENKIGLCSHRDYGDGICKQYDVDGKTNITEFYFKIDEGKRNFFAVQNTEKGFILAAATKHRASDDDEWKHFIVVFDDQGKQQKYVKIDLEHNKILAFPFLYKNSNGQYCVIFIQSCDRVNTPPCTHHQPKDTELFTSTRCFSKTELF